MRIIKTYKNRKDYSIESGAQKIIDSLNSEMYSTDPLKLDKDITTLKQKYPASYETIKRCDPGIIVSVQRGKIRDEIAEIKDEISGKFSI